MTFRKFLFWTHLCVGVAAGLIIFSMSLTGMIIAFEHQIVDFAERTVQNIPAPPSDAKRLSLDRLKEKASAQVPEGQPTVIVVRAEPTRTVAIGFGKRGTFYVDPYNGNVLGKDSKIHDAMHEITDFHRWLGSREIGRPITGASNLAFFALALSGFYLWFQKTVWKFNRRLEGKARDWNWHNVFGIWSLPFLLVITLTGTVMSYPWANNLLYKLSGTPPPPAAERPAASTTTTPNDKTPREELQSLDLFFKHAQQQQPNWVTIMLRLPQRPGAQVNASIQEPGGTFPRRSQLAMKPSTGEIVKWEPYGALNRGRKWRLWARYLHTGEAGGLVGQGIAFLASAGGVMLVWTGVCLAWRRFKNRSPLSS